MFSIFIFDTLNCNNYCLTLGRPQRNQRYQTFFRFQFLDAGLVELFENIIVKTFHILPYFNSRTGGTKKKKREILIIFLARPTAKFRGAVFFNLFCKQENKR